MAELNDVPDILEKLQRRLFSRALLNKIGLAGIRLIKARTRLGIDVKGAAFEPYSDGWAIIRQAHNLPTAYVNLEFNDIDGMLKKIDHVVAADLESVEIDILDPDKRKIASYHNDLGAGKSHVKRRFFDINQQEMKKIDELVEADLNLLLADLTREAD
jgi:hypothetical protein